MSAPRVRKAQELLDELGITEPDEIDLEAIAAHVDATVVYQPLSGAEARIVGSGDAAIITVNQGALRSRQRFSIGHELGHWMYDRGKYSLSCSRDKQERFFTGTDKESLANRFASELLLPEEMFKRHFQNRPPTLETIRDLAEQFKASLTATARRVVDLGGHPAMVICSSRNKREWFRGSAEVDRKLWPHTYLSADTLASELFDEPGYLEAMEEVDADAWIDHENAADYVVVESSVKVTADLVLTVLWWKNQTQILELED